MFKLYIKRGTETVTWQHWRDEPTKEGAMRVASEMARAYRHSTKVVNPEGRQVARFAAGTGRMVR